MPREKTFISLPEGDLNRRQIKAILGYKDLRLKDIATDLGIPPLTICRMLRKDGSRYNLKPISDYIRQKFTA